MFNLFHLYDLTSGRTCKPQKKKLIPSNYTGWFIGTPITGYNSYKLNKAVLVQPHVRPATSHPATRFNDPLKRLDDLRQSHQSEKSSWCGVGFLFLNAFTLLLISWPAGASKEIDLNTIPWDERYILIINLPTWMVDVSWKNVGKYTIHGLLGKGAKQI